MRLLSIHPGVHDAHITAIERGKIIRHLELERSTDSKHYGYLNFENWTWRPNDFDGHLEYFLDSMGWTLGSISAICIPSSNRHHHAWVDKYAGVMEAHDVPMDDITSARHFRSDVFGGDKLISLASHHLSHMAAAYYTSPFEDALVFAYDGLGEWTITTSWAVGEGCKLSYVGDLTRTPLPGFTVNQIGGVFGVLGQVMPFLGKNVLSTAGKVMGLSSYGEYVPEWKDSLGKIIFSDPSKHVGGMLIEAVEKDLRLSPQELSDPNSSACRNLAKTVQVIAEDYVCDLVAALVEKTGKRKVCLAGGCALNVLVNEELLRRGVVDDLYVVPACSDCGLGIGVGLYTWHNVLGYRRTVKNYFDPYMGDRIYDLHALDEQEGITVQEFFCEEDMVRHVAGLLASGKIVGWAQGRAEIGPRALGHRSILADPRQARMKDEVNKIKNREYWRPFAPVCVEEKAGRYFDFEGESPYMLRAVPVKTPGLLPAITHVDGTARLQTVTEDQDPLLHLLLSEFEKLSGVPVLLNTSLNDRGKPLLNYVSNLVDMLKNTTLDYGVVGNKVISSP